MKKWLLMSVLVLVSFPLCAMDSDSSSDRVEFDTDAVEGAGNALGSLVAGLWSKMPTTWNPFSKSPTVEKKDTQNVPPQLVQVSAITDSSDQGSGPDTSSSVPKDLADQVTPVQPTPSPSPTPDNSQADSSDQSTTPENTSPSAAQPSSSQSFKNYMMDLLWRKHGFLGKTGLLTSAGVVLVSAFYLVTRKTKAEKQMLIVKRMSTEVLIAIEQLDGPDPQRLNEQCDSLLNTLTALSAQLTYVSESTRDNLRGSIAQLVEAIREQANAQDAYHALIAALCTCEQEIKIKGEEEAQKNPGIATRFLRWIKERFSSNKQTEAAQV